MNSWLTYIISFSGMIMFDIRAIIIYHATALILAPSPPCGNATYVNCRRRSDISINITNYACVIHSYAYIEWASDETTLTSHTPSLPYYDFSLCRVAAWQSSLFITAVISDDFSPTIAWCWYFIAAAGHRAVNGLTSFLRDVRHIFRYIHHNYQPPQSFACDYLFRLSFIYQYAISVHYL